jgi:hypothetical protein
MEDDQDFIDKPALTRKLPTRKPALRKLPSLSEVSLRRPTLRKILSLNELPNLLDAQTSQVLEHPQPSHIPKAKLKRKNSLPFSLRHPRLALPNFFTNQADREDWEIITEAQRVWDSEWFEKAVACVAECKGITVEEAWWMQFRYWIRELEGNRWVAELRLRVDLWV